ncbi:MAG: serine/threonine protein kinase [Oscillospiraceae bacterium]|nr:serine/threonine protein kinase [Oscillospiraceae bacterium]
MSDTHAGQFMQSFTNSEFFEELSESYDILECIGETGLSETYLLSEKTTKTLYVLKKQKDADRASRSEAELLSGLEHAGLPVFDKEIKLSGEIYPLRKYAEGEPLSKYLSGTQTADPRQAVDVLLRLCDVLSYLHSLPEPIIHRDIKPSNIIYNQEDDTVQLIDFGISRKYSETSDADTTYFGTHKFAPPEQYGFAQTDARSDIYSLGVVLRYWLTGAADSTADVSDKALARIINKCTQLDPKKRFQDVVALKKALVIYKNRTRRRVLASVACVSAACLLVFSAFSLLPYVQVLMHPSVTPPVAALPNPPPGGITTDPNEDTNGSTYENNPPALGAAETVDVQLIIREAMNWSDHKSDVVTITGDGQYRAKIEIDGGCQEVLNLGIIAAGATFEGEHEYMMKNAKPAPSRFWQAEIIYELVIINDEFEFYVAGDENWYTPFVSGDWFESAFGYVYSLIWNAWYEPQNRIIGVKRNPRDHNGPESAFSFSVMQVELITSIEVIFTISDALP